MAKAVDMSDAELIYNISNALIFAGAKLGATKDDDAAEAFGAILDAQGMAAALRARIELKELVNG